MKKAIQFLSLCLTAILLAACNSNQPAAEQTDHSGHADHSAHSGHSAHAAHDTTAAKTIAATTDSTPAGSAIRLKDDNLNAIYRYYTDLTTSLTANDVAGAKVAAAAIEMGAAKVKGGQDVASAAAAITITSDIAAQRSHYATLSDSFIALLKKTGIANGDVYVLHCPMARNDKGAFWLSNTKSVRNPYYGELMLNCGSVTETLK